MLNSALHEDVQTAIEANDKSLSELKKALKREKADSDVWLAFNSVLDTSKHVSDSSKSLVKRHRVAVDTLSTVADHNLALSVAIANAGKF